MDPDLRRTLADLDRDRFRANMDDHYQRYVAERGLGGWEPVVRGDGTIGLMPSPETIRRAIWGGRRGGEDGG